MYSLISIKLFHLRLYFQLAEKSIERSTLSCIYAFAYISGFMHSELSLEEPLLEVSHDLTKALLDLARITSLRFDRSHGLLVAECFERSGGAQISPPGEVM